MKLPNPPLITAAGEYELDGLQLGKAYLLTLKGSFGGARVELQFWNDALGAFTPVENGVFTELSVVHEVTVHAPSVRVKFLVTGGTPNLAITFIPKRA